MQRPFLVGLVELSKAELTITTLNFCVCSKSTTNGVAFSPVEQPFAICTVADPMLYFDHSATYSGPSS